MNIEQALSQGCQALAKVSDSQRLDCELLLAASIHRSRTFLYAHPDYVLTPSELKTWQHLLQQRQNHYPLAYLLGEKEFWSLNFKLSCHTLIPRPATEALIEYILNHYSEHQPLQVCDLGTGSGAIAITLAKERPDWQITAIDIHASAIAMADLNAKTHQCSNIDFIVSPWLKRLAYRKFDLIVSNPPYIGADDPHLCQGDLIHEPKLALISPKQGMHDLIQIMQEGLQHLNPKGQLVLEHGHTQQEQVIDAMRTLGYERTGGGLDQDKLARYSFGFKSSCSSTLGVVEQIETL
jgi:release factor glutamine methyltransferase